MEPVRVPLDAVDFSIPREQGTVRLLVELPRGREEFAVFQLELWNDHILSTVKSAPSSSGAAEPDDDVVDRRITEISRLAFGDGRWLNMGRVRRPEPGAQIELGDGPDISAVAEESMVDMLSQQLDASSMTPTKHSPKKRKREQGIGANTISTAHELHKRIQSLTVHTPNAKAKLQELSVKTIVAKCIAAADSECRKGIKLLCKGCDSIADGYHYAELIAYRLTREDDPWERLENLVHGQLRKISHAYEQKKRDVSRNKWSHAVLADNTRRARRSLDPNFEDNPDSTIRQNESRREKRTHAFNRIFNGLYCSKGADAWVFLAGLQARGHLIADLTQIAKERIEELASVAAQKLADCPFEDVPDDTLIVHFPAWLTWLLGQPDAPISYATICEVLGLENLAHDDPGIAAKLDKVSEKYSWVERDNPEHEGAWESFEKEAREAATVSLGQLRDVHRRQVNPDCRCFNHTTMLQPIDQGHPRAVTTNVPTPDGGSASSHVSDEQTPNEQIVTPETSDFAQPSATRPPANIASNLSLGNPESSERGHSQELSMNDIEPQLVPRSTEAGAQLGLTPVLRPIRPCVASPDPQLHAAPRSQDQGSTIAGSRNVPGPQCTGGTVTAEPTAAPQPPTQPSYDYGVRLHEGHVPNTQNGLLNNQFSVAGSNTPLVDEPAVTSGQGGSHGSLAGAEASLASGQPQGAIANPPSGHYHQALGEIEPTGPLSGQSSFPSQGGTVAPSAILDRDESQGCSISLPPIDSWYGPQDESERRQTQQHVLPNPGNIGFSGADMNVLASLGPTDMARLDFTDMEFQGTLDPANQGASGFTNDMNFLNSLAPAGQGAGSGFTNDDMVFFDSLEPADLFDLGFTDDNMGFSDSLEPADQGAGSGFTNDDMVFFDSLEPADLFGLGFTDDNMGFSDSLGPANLDVAVDNYHPQQIAASTFPDADSQAKNGLIDKTTTVVSSLNSSGRERQQDGPSRPSTPGNILATAS